MKGDHGPDSGTALKSDYKSYTGRKVIFITICAVAAVLLLGLSIYIGGSDLSLGRIYELLWHHLCGWTYQKGTDDFLDDFVVWNVRLPRAIFALVAGAGLAVGGVVMQSVMKNPLADPYTTGISSGACLGVAVAVILGLSFTNAGIGSAGLVLNAFLFAVIPMILIIIIAPRAGSSTATLILAGVAISYLFNALTTLLMMSTDAETLSLVYRWQVGSLTNVKWSSVPLMFFINIGGILTVSFLAARLNILVLGDDSAKSLGLNADAMRVLCLFILSLMVASVVSYAGIIGFIGLVSPHIVRMLIDADNRFVIPASAAFGAVFLLGADIIARWLSPTDAVPVGVVLAFIGAPIFLYLIIRQKKAIW